MTGTACPPEWTAVDMNGQQAGQNVWEYMGDQTRQDNHYGEHGRGTCEPWGHTGWNDLYEFTIPSDGNYTVFTYAFGATDTFMFVRSECGVESDEAELACNDDEPGMPDSGAWLWNQNQGDKVYIFVDSAGFGGQGQYELEIRRTGP